jgi:hypothetical protein
VRRTVLALSAVAVVGGLVAPAFATQELPVGVTYDTKDGVSVGSTFGKQPLFGAHASERGACFGFSYQMPTCVDTGITTK